MTRGCLLPSAVTLLVTTALAGARTRGLHVRREAGEPLPRPVFVIHREYAQEMGPEGSLGSVLPSEARVNAPTFTVQYPPTVAPAATATVCADLDNWKDSLEHTCAQYAAGQFCTPSGGYGPGWPSLFTFEDHKVQGVSAKEACCACGGGVRESTSGCLAACGQRQTAEEVEAETRIAENLKSLQQEAQHKINTVGTELDVDATKTALANWSTGVSAELATASAAQRAQAINSSRESFDYQTTAFDKSNLTEAALHDLLILGYTASKNLTAESIAGRGAFPLDLYGASQNMNALKASYHNAAAAWLAALTTTNSTVQAGAQLWHNTFAHLNASWGEVLESGRITNEAHEKSLGPLQKVRWSKQSMRLASDLSEMAEVHAMDTDAKVSRAEDQAQRALAMTSTNSGILDELETEADEVSQNAMSVQTAAQNEAASAAAR